MTIELAPLIVADRQTLGGKPRIKGTRISVDLILERLASGWSVADILESYSHVTEEGVYACINYARNVVAEESLLFSFNDQIKAAE